MPLWLAAQPLVLASKSAARRALLEAAGIAIEIHPADVDERAIEARAGLEDAATVAALLAREKAKAVAADRAGARAQLAALRGKTHMLHSAVAVARGGALMFEHVDAAHLAMRNFSDDFLESYLDRVGDDATTSVGGYQLEGVGLQLFERVDGDHFTVLGLPLLPLLDWLRRSGALAK
jgi:septum formation protein